MGRDGRPNGHMAPAQSPIKTHLSFSFLILRKRKRKSLVTGLVTRPLLPHLALPAPLEQPFSLYFGSFWPPDRPLRRVCEKVNNHRFQQKRCDLRGSFRSQCRMRSRKTTAVQDKTLVLFTEVLAEDPALLSNDLLLKNVMFCKGQLPSTSLCVSARTPNFVFPRR